MVQLVLAASLLFLPIAENEDCIACNVSVWELRYGKELIHEFEKKEHCEAIRSSASAPPGLECVEVWVQRYEG